MGDFKCESEVFNGPVCKVQCDRCKPAPRYSTNFGSVVSGYLDSRSMSQSSLASIVGRSPVHVNHVITGRYARATASWADIISNALDLTDEERYRLHLAAARDQGFKL